MTGCETQCRACSHRELSRDQSESQKLNWLKTRLGNPGWSIAPIQTVNQDSSRWGYRNKTLLHAHWNGEFWEFGTKLKKRLGDKWVDEVIDIPECPVHSNEIRAIVKILRKTLPSPEKLNLVFLAISGSLVTLVVKSSRLPDVQFLNKLDLHFLSEEGGVRGIFINLNPAAGNRVFSTRGWHHLWGEKRAVLGEHRYGPASFQQLLPSLYEQALQAAAEFLSPSSRDAVLDLCSGTGRSLGFWKAAGAGFLGVELSGEAVECAEHNIGDQPSISILRGRVSERLPQIEEWFADQHLLGKKRRLIFANPPRLGLETRVTSWLGDWARPEKIAYLSCSAGTLERDLSLLIQAGYVVNKIIPYDFFPQTHHVEALACLTLQKSS